MGTAKDTELALSSLTHANDMRQEVWPGSEETDVPFRLIELMGEAGELCNKVKKLIRHERNIKGNSGAETHLALMEAIQEEAGDVLITLDLLCSMLGINLADATAQKFNLTSVKHNLPISFIRQEDEATGQAEWLPIQLTLG